MKSEEEISDIIRSRLQKAGRPASPEMCRGLARLVREYEIAPDLKSFGDPRGVVFWDQDGRSLGLYEVSLTKNFLTSAQEPHTDILVLMQDSLRLGWVGQDQLIRSPQGWSVLRGQLAPMPKEYRFTIPCPHLSRHGGWFNTDQQAWVCYGCGGLVPDL
jgi:hypothetical protein